MKTRPLLLPVAAPSFTSSSTYSSAARFFRSKHAESHHGHAPIPTPTSFVPDPPTLLTLLGRGLAKHSSKIPSWHSLFTMTSRTLRESGIEPARNRRYLMRWLEKYRRGEYGMGGDLETIEKGIAECRMTEAPGPTTHKASSTSTKRSGTKTLVTTGPLRKEHPGVERSRSFEKRTGPKIRLGRGIIGRHIEHVQGSGGLAGRLKAAEGLWEDRRGHKVDGGERRKAEVRAKQRSQSRANSR